MPKPQHWGVTVFADSERIDTIESEYLCGREITQEDEKTIRRAARHLLSFIGDPPPPPRVRQGGGTGSNFFYVDDEE